jgi:hypothetical protein
MTERRTEHPDHPDLTAAIEAAAVAFLVDSHEIRAKRTARLVVQARQVAMYLLRRLDRYSYPEIGRMMQMDHSTVQHAFQQVAQRRLADPVFDATVASAEAHARARATTATVRLRGDVVSVRLSIVVAPDGSYAVFGASRCTAAETSTQAHRLLADPRPTVYEVGLDLDVHLPLPQERP